MSKKEVNRRDFSKLATIAGGGLLANAAAQSLLGAPQDVVVDEGRESPIQVENRKPGTRDWMLSKTRIDPASKYRSPWIEGYCSHASIEAAETLKIMVSTAPTAKFTIDFYRMGFYQGHGGRWMHSSGPLAGKPQAVPRPEKRRLLFCQWDCSYELVIPSDWLSGVYVGKLTEANEGLQSYVIFIVRDRRPADLMFQCSDHTWHAYNRWPSQFSLYDDGVDVWHWGGDAEVSFARPYAKYCQIFDAPLSLGSGEFFLWEFPFVYWLESLGYDATYVSNNDTHHAGESILRSKGFLSVGHDEYWTIEMFENIKKAIAQGVHVGFFSGNAVCGRVQWEESTRSFYRAGVFGPPGGTKEFAKMSSLKHEPPYANEIIGAHSTGVVTGGADWICTAPEHWIYEGTGMKLGERIPGLIGWEWHGDPAPIPSLKVIAQGKTESAPGKPNGGEYTATIYEGPKNNWVLNTSTCWWSDGLSEPPGYERPKVYTEPKGVDRRVQQITKNFLDRAIASEK